MLNTETKTCSITEDEIKELIRFHGMGLHDVTDDAIDRINYLNRRLKAEPKNNTSTVPALPEPQSTEEKKVTSW